MKNIILIMITIAYCINFSCKQAEFKTVQGKKEKYSITIPSDYTDKVQFKGESPFIDLEYSNSKGESVVVSLADIPPGDTSNHIEQLSSLSDSAFMKKVYPEGNADLQILERRMTLISGINSYFIYYHTDKLYYQLLFQKNRSKILTAVCTYDYKKNDSLKQYYYGVVTSVVWDKE